jgi:hypothetical protein
MLKLEPISSLFPHGYQHRLIFLLRKETVCFLLEQGDCYMTANDLPIGVGVAIPLDMSVIYVALLWLDLPSP